MKINAAAMIGVIFEVLAVSWAIANGFRLALKRLLTPLPPKSLKNEVLLVTGGSNGIGREILQKIALLETDLTLISWDVDTASNEATIEMLKDVGVKRAVAMTVDVKNKNQVSAAAARVREEFGDVTMLFNNAGIAGPVGKCWEMDSSDQELTIQVNFMSHFYTLQEFLPWMVQNNRGNLIATCSALGYSYLNNGAPYVASKHAILGYYNCLKEDLRVASSDVRVSVVYPGMVSTDLVAPFESHFKSVPLQFLTKGTSASSAGRQIIDGVLHNKANIYVPWLFGFLHFLSGTFIPEVYSSVLDFFGSGRVDIPESSRKFVGLE